MNNLSIAALPEFLSKMKPNTTEVLRRWNKVCNLAELMELLDRAQRVTNQCATEIDVDIDFVELEAECLSDGSITYNVYMTEPTQN